MRTFKKIALGMVALLLLLITVPSDICLAAAVISVNGGEQIDLQPSGSTSVGLAIDGIPDLGPGNGLGAFTLRLSWNNSIINVTNVTASTISGWTIVPGTPSGGSVTITGFTATTPLTGGASVATLSISAVGIGNTSISITVLDFGDFLSAAHIDNSVLGAGVVVAAPPQQYTLTMAVNGSGTTTPSVGGHNYNEGTVVNINANPANGWQFESWSGDVANPGSASTTVTVDADKAVTANFSQSTTTSTTNTTTTTQTTTGVSPPVQYILTMAVTGKGTTVPGLGGYLFNAGTVVNINAEPATGWQFDKWSGDVADPDSANTTVTMDSDKTITAIFKQGTTTTTTTTTTTSTTTSPTTTITTTTTASSEPPPPEQYTLTMAVSDSGDTSPPAGDHIYDAGAVVDISAEPDTGWQFDSWSGDVADPDSANTTVTVDADKTVTANFSLIDSTPPEVVGVACSNITKTGADIAWLTDEPGTSQVEYWASPSQFTTLDEELVTLHLVHLTDLAPAQTYHYKTMSVDEAGNLTVSEEFTFTTLGLPPMFVVTDWNLPPTEFYIGQKMTVTCSVKNMGDIAGDYQLEYYLDGTLQQTKSVHLEAGASQEVSFTIENDTAGTHEVNISGLNFTVTVKEPEASGGMKWWQIALIAVIGTLLLVVLVIYFISKKREKPQTKQDRPHEYRMPVCSAHEVVQPPEAVAGEEQNEKPEKQEQEQTEESEQEETRPEPALTPAGSISVTPAALAKLEKTLAERTGDHEFSFRMIRSPANPGKHTLARDKERDGDLVINKGENKILLISPEVAADLEGVSLDYIEGYGLKIIRKG